MHSSGRLAIITQVDTGIVTTFPTSNDGKLNIGEGQELFTTKHNQGFRN